LHKKLTNLVDHPNNYYSSKVAGFCIGMVSFKFQDQSRHSPSSSREDLNPNDLSKASMRATGFEVQRHENRVASQSDHLSAASEKSSMAMSNSASPPKVSREHQALLRAIENSPHKEELKLLENKLAQAKSPDEAAKTLKQIKAILTGATGDQSIEEFRKGGLDKLLEQLKKATDEVQEAYKYSITRPSTLIPFVRTMEQEKAVKAWSEASDQVREYIKKNVGLLNPDSLRAANDLSHAATMDGARKIIDLSSSEQKTAETGMAI
jgi:hypothetical protein